MLLTEDRVWWNLHEISISLPNYRAGIMIQEYLQTIYEVNFVKQKLWTIFDLFKYLTSFESDPAWEQRNDGREREHKVFIFTGLFLLGTKTFGSSVISVPAWCLFPITQSWIIWLVIQDHGCFFFFYLMLKMRISISLLTRQPTDKAFFDRKFWNCTELL